jgi:VanZ family protein
LTRRVLIHKTVVWFAVAATACLLVGTHISEEHLRGFAMDNDKFLHFVIYFIVAFLYGFALRAGGWYSLLLRASLFLGLAVLAALDEYTQQFFHRQTELLDYCADLAGIALGVIISKVARHGVDRMVEKRRSR